MNNGIFDFPLFVRVQHMELERLQHLLPVRQKSGPAFVLIHGSASLPPPPTASSRACSQATFDLAGRRLLVLARPPDLQIEPNPSVIGPYENE
jgi:hypothetical protein